MYGGDADGALVIHRGMLWSAHAGHRTGRSALHWLLFEEDPLVTCSGVTGEPGPANLPQLPWEQLLLDLAKDHDEGTREVPVVGGEDDFSDIFDESPTQHCDDVAFERLLDEAHDAVLKKSYAEALRAFESALELRPDDETVRSNVDRLRELAKD